jgi:hypothetical protein
VSTVVLVPSRNRPGNVARLMRAWTDTGATAELVVLVDDDDPELAGYEALGLPSLIVGPRQRIGPLLNDWAPHFAAEADVVGFMGDDHCPRTYGWDARIADASTPWTVVYGNDLLQGQNIPTAVFMGSGLVRELGYFNPPGCQHLYLDNAWKFYGESLGTLRYLPDVIVEHLHFLAGKAPKDALYAEVNHTSMYDHDRVAFDAWRVGAASDDLARVRAAMNREEAPA